MPIAWVEKVVEFYMTQYVRTEDLPLINAALERGEVVKIRHTDKGGTKITRELSQLIKTRGGTDKKR